MKPNKLTLKGLAHSKAKNEEARELLKAYDGLTAWYALAARAKTLWLLRLTRTKRFVRAYIAVRNAVGIREAISSL